MNSEAAEVRTGGAPTASPWSPGRPGASGRPPCSAWPPPGGRWWPSTGAPTTPASPTRSGTRAALDGVVAPGRPAAGRRPGGVIGPRGRHHRRGRLGCGRGRGRGALRRARRHGGGGRGHRRGRPPVGDARRPAGRRPRRRPARADRRRPGRDPRACCGARAPRQGRYLAVASAAATTGLPRLAAYGAAKAGVAGLVRGLAVELGGTGITANAVCPGSTDTAMLAESARLYDLDGTGAVRRPAARRPPARRRTRWPPPWCGWPAPTGAR